MFPKLNLCISHLDTNRILLQIVIMIYVYVIVKYKLAMLKNFLVSQLVILFAGMLTLITLLKSVILIYSYFTTLIFDIILISVVLSGVTVVLHWKINL